MGFRRSSSEVYTARCLFFTSAVKQALLPLSPAGWAPQCCPASPAAYSPWSSRHCSQPQPRAFPRLTLEAATYSRLASWPPALPLSLALGTSGSSRALDLCLSPALKAMHSVPSMNLFLWPPAGQTGVALGRAEAGRATRVELCSLLTGCVTLG